MAKRTLRTELCDVLGIEYPIMLAGMGGIAGPALTAAVSNAGGLGVLGATGLTSEQVRSWIRETKRLTDKPFGVDLLLPVMAESGTRQTMRIELPAEHVAFVKRLKQELKVPDFDITRGSMLTVEEVGTVIDAILEEGVAVLAAGLGTPEGVTPRMHAAGIKVVSLVGNVRNARRVAERGADIVVAQGHEAGGHTGRIGTMALVPQVVDAVHPLPVVAAGGIGDGRGLVASLALGAVGVWVGSAFILTPEAFDIRPISSSIDHERVSSWHQNMISATEEDTIVSRTYTGKTARTLKNKFVELWAESGMSYLPMPLQGLLLANLMAGLRQAGMLDYLVNFAGQITGMLKETKPAEQIVDEMVAQANEILENGLAVVG